MPKLIYLASPFFNEFELECVKRAEKILTDRGLKWTGTTSTAPTIW